MYNKGRRTGKLVNWLTVWGLIVSCIAFNRYVDYQQQRQQGKWYRAQYKAESRRVDSLLIEKRRLEERLRKLENSENPDVSTVQNTDIRPETIASNEL